MTYREKLNKVNELGINICDLIVADVCDSLFEFKYSEEEFEQLCEFACWIYLKAEALTTDAIALCINDLIVKEDKSIEEILKMTKWDFINKASNYLD